MQIWYWAAHSGVFIVASLFNTSDIKTMQKRQFLIGAGALAGSLTLPHAMAQSAAWPSKPLRMIVPFAAGVSPDVVARIFADRLSQVLGQPIVVDNRPGAGGIIGAEAAAAAAPDGYTLFFSVKAVMAIAPHVFPKAKFHPVNDFRAVSQVLTLPHIITASPNAPFSTMRELVEQARQKPGQFDFGSLGVGSQPHVAMEAWARQLGIKLTHIPYKTTPAADVMAGVVSLYVEASTTAIPSIKAGKVKALAVSGATRLPSLPDVPTVTEFQRGLDDGGIVGSTWHGLFVPKGTPDEIVARLSRETVRIAKLPEVQERLVGLGATPTGTTVQELTAVVTQDYAYWGKTVRELGVTAE
jgi:tripartite-type tricarboxylate transporter receptor subunit TctC